VQTAARARNGGGMAERARNGSVHRRRCAPMAAALPVPQQRTLRAFASLSKSLVCEFDALPMAPYSTVTELPCSRIR
jgi:hypothetical protein